MSKYGGDNLSAPLLRQFRTFRFSKKDPSGATCLQSSSTDRGVSFRLSCSDIIGILRRRQSRFSHQNNIKFSFARKLACGHFEKRLTNFSSSFFVCLFILRTLSVSLLVRCVGVGISMLGALNVFGYPIS